MAKGQPVEVLAAIEQALVENPVFGDSDYIVDQLSVCLKRRLEKVGTRLPVARRLCEAFESANGGSLHHVIGDTVVRCAIVHSHIQLETGAPYGLPLTECEKVFAATVDHLQQGRYDSPLDHRSLRRYGSEPYHGWVWTDEHPYDVFGRSFRYLLRERYAAVPVTPTDDEVAMLSKGAELLRELLPRLTASALQHALIVTFVPSAGSWKGVASSSQFHLGGSIFLGRWQHTPWWMAEHLLHESLHQKLYDFRHAHALLEPEYARDDAPRVDSPWNSQQLIQANQWDVHRVYAAFHVYVHLALLAMVAEQRAPELEATYGPLHAMLESHKALERAHYLGEKLKAACWNELGAAGKSMADWLASVLPFLDPAPPPKGSFVHLSLDLYETEANRVAAALKESDTGPSSLPANLVPLAKKEIEGARCLLSTIHAEQQLQSLDSAVTQFNDDELGKNFPQLRCIIGRTIIDASYSRFRLTESGAHDELLREMIQSASRQVYAVLAGYPMAVAEAKRRAHEQRFTMSCDDRVGQLLAMLAAAVRLGGRILEIGTGVGVGIAWIATGLRERTDVEVVSLEVDERLSNSARQWPWPSNVQIFTADGLSTIAALGTFDLIFADASPIKYTNIEMVLAALRTAGVLLVDDLGEPSFSERQRFDKNSLRRALLNHRDLQAVDVDWSTGLIVATRTGPAPRPALHRDAHRAEGPRRDGVHTPVS